MEERFNVVCVTKRSSNDSGSFSSPIHWHQDITGEIILDTEKNTVTFVGNSMEFPVKYTREGLDSMSHVIAVEAKHGMLDIWELYTDTPAKGSNATPEEIRENARRTVARRY